MIFDFLNPRLLFKIYEGKWIGKGVKITKKCDKKIISKKIAEMVEIKKINDYTFEIKILSKCDNKKVDLLGFINKETGILEAVYPNEEGLTNGIIQFYFHGGILISSDSKNTLDGLESSTIKLIPYRKPCKPCKSSSSSSSSSCSSSSSSSSSCTKPKPCKDKCKIKCGKKCD